MRERAAAGAPEGVTVVSGCQTQGRGRIGRTFYSPSQTGVYLSLLLRPPHCQPQEAVKLTTMAAVAVCEAIEEVSSEQAQIKWVNDIFIGDKKVCGILTEAALGLEDGCLDYAVLGVGINVYVPKDGFPDELVNDIFIGDKKVCGILTEAALGLEDGCLDYAVLGVGINVYVPKDGFPDELQKIAGSVFETAQNDGKNRIAAAFLNHFMADYKNRDVSDYAARYRARSLVIGRDIWVMQSGQAYPAHVLDDIWVMQSGQAYPAHVLDVDRDCRLHIQYADGRTDCLTSGEISIRVRSEGV